MIEYIYCGRDGQKVEITEKDRRNATLAYLSQAIDLRQRINLKKEKIGILRDSLSLQSTQLSDMPKNPSPPASAMEEKLVKILTLEQEVREAEDAEVRLKDEMMSLIGKVERPEEQMVLIGCFLNLKTLTVVASEMYITEASGWRVRRRALESIETILEQEGELGRWIRRQKLWM